MIIAIFGGSGFIGGNLARALTDRGDEVVIVTRKERSSAGSIKYVTWQQLERDPSVLEKYDAFVNLAGESINQRWSTKAKDRILTSRLNSVAAVSKLVDSLQAKPEVVVNGTGMSIYGYSDTETFDEDSPHHLTDFLARVVDKWERAVDEIRDVRIVKLRVGLVLGKDGGAFPLMRLPYKLFVGGRVGTGKQWHSWIHIDDMVGIILYSIDHSEVNGPLNCTAPNPAKNNEFGRQVGRSLGRPHWLPVPSIAFKLAFGEMSEVLLQGQRVIPKRMLDYGYKFQYPTLEQALAHLHKRGSIR